MVKVEYELIGKFINLFFNDFYIEKNRKIFNVSNNCFRKFLEYFVIFIVN